MAKRKTVKRKATLGTVEGKGSGYRARYERHGQRHTPGHTFSTEELAWAWLRSEQALIDRDNWTPPAARRAQAKAVTEADELTLDGYARTWVENRVTPKGTPLHPSTRAAYLSYLDGILTPLASLPLVRITPADVNGWYGSHGKTASLRHKAYSFAKSVMRSAVEVDELMPRNPFIVDNATRKPGVQSSAVKAVKALSHGTVNELAGLVQRRDRAMILLLAYCCLRTGEACALRRGDLDIGATAEGVPYGWLTVERAIFSHGGQRHEGGTKTGAQGERVIPVPPHLLGTLTEHVGRWAEAGPDGLLFPSTNPAMAFRTTQQINGHAAVLRTDGTVRKAGYGWYGARIVAGVPEMRLHWLRHWGATLWDEAGTPEALRRAILGHAQPGMTGSYTHPDTAKASPYALRVSELAGWSPGRVPGVRQGGAGALASLLGALDDETLIRTLGTLDAAQVTEVVPQLPPARIGAVVAAMAGAQRPTLRVVEGGGQR